MQDETTKQWLEALAAKQPAPGGGAAAALLAAVSAALIEMAANYTTGGKWSDKEDHMKEIITEVSKLRKAALILIEEDAKAFTAVSAAYKLPRNNEVSELERQKVIQTASLQAAMPPRKTAELSVRLVEISAELVDSSNPNVISDVAVASITARGAIESSIVNMEINQRNIVDAETNNSLDLVIADAQKAIKTADQTIMIIRKQLQ